MAIRKVSLKTTPEHHGKRLDQVLAEWLPSALNEEVSKAKARKLIVAGAVYLNRKRIRIASRNVLSGALLEVFVDSKKLQAGAPALKDQPFAMDASRVLYEDEYLIAVNKPPGLPTQPTLDEARDNLFAAVKRFIAQRDRVASPYIGLHHRLDRDTSGVVLFTKKTEANAGVGEAFAKHGARKVYHALSLRPASGAPGSSWTVRDYLARAEVQGKGKHRGRWRSVRSGGDPAHTEFQLLEDLGSALWIEARPLTGRTHQIRVHLSEGGMPILGDSLYGGNDGIPAGLPAGLEVPRLLLHAHRLTLKHPISNVELSIQSPLPPDFTRCLKILQARQANSIEDRR